jgi:ribose 5-phosphate isomerase
VAGSALLPDGDTQPPALPACLGIVGLGLVGASLARAYRAARPGGRLIAVEPDSEVRSAAIADGLADVALGGPGHELGGCDLVVLCTPLAALLALLAPVSAHMAEGSVLSDVAGVKQPVLAAARTEVKTSVRFVGAHPMFGGSDAGYAAARDDRWRGGTVVVCDEGDDPSPAARAAVRAVVDLHRGLGADVLLCSAAEHDEAAAFASHLPYLAASALTLAVEGAPPLARQMAGAGLRDSTRLASFAFEVQGEVARQNASLPEAIRRFAERLAELTSALPDAPRARALLVEARAARRSMVTARPEPRPSGSAGAAHLPQALAAAAAPDQDARMSTSAGPDPADLDRVAHSALGLVSEGMLLGLGTGRAAEAFIRLLGDRVRAGLRVRAVTTSVRSESLAREVGIELLSLDQAVSLDIAFDGADEVTPDLALTKGLGGALLRERVVAHEAKMFVVLVTPEKLVDKLGARTPIPIEVVPFARAAVARNLEKLGGRPVTRTRDGADYFTDNGNLIFDTHFAPIDAPRELDAAVRRVPGVVDTGIFLDMADLVLVGAPAGVRELRRPSR